VFATLRHGKLGLPGEQASRSPRNSKPRAQYYRDSWAARPGARKGFAAAIGFQMQMHYSGKSFAPKNLPACLGAIQATFPNVRLKVRKGAGSEKKWPEARDMLAPD
jgi:hypothetical protein